MIKKNSTKTLGDLDCSGIVSSSHSTSKPFVLLLLQTRQNDNMF